MSNTFKPIAASDLTTSQLGQMIKVQLSNGQGITGSLREIRMHLETAQDSAADYAEAREITVRIQDLDVPVSLTPSDRLELLSDSPNL